VNGQWRYFWGIMARKASVISQCLSHATQYGSGLGLPSTTNLQPHSICFHLAWYFPVNLGGKTHRFPAYSLGRVGVRRLTANLEDLPSAQVVHGDPGKKRARPARQLRSWPRFYCLTMSASFKTVISTRSPPAGFDAATEAIELPGKDRITLNLGARTQLGNRRLMDCLDRYPTAPANSRTASASAFNIRIWGDSRTRAHRAPGVA
jgi:hypothetical protein